MSGPGIVPHGPTVAGYRCILSKSSAQLAALGAISTKTYTFGPFPSGCYLLGGYLYIPTVFDAGLDPVISVGTTTYPICCVDGVALSIAKDPTSFSFIAELGGANPNANMSGESVTVTIDTTGNFSAFTTGNFELIVLVSAPMQTVTAT